MIFDRAVSLAGGRVGISRQRLPMRAPGGDALLAPGPIAVGTLDMLPAAAAIVERVAPWTSLMLAPSIWNVDAADSSYAELYSTERRTGRDGTRYYRVNGLAWTVDGQSRSLVALQQPHLLLPVIHHELFHNVSKRLPAEAHAVLVH